MDSIKKPIQELMALHQEEKDLRLSYTQELEQISAKRHALLSELMSSCSDNTDSASNILWMSRSMNPMLIATANGRRLSDEQLLDISEDKFDVVLDLGRRSLKYRKDPKKPSRLVKSESTLPGPHRMQILAYMLEHPGHPFHSCNIYRVYTSKAEIRSQNTFTRTIGVLRAALGQNDTSGPYITKELAWEGITNSKRGCVYLANSNWRYLVLRGT